MLDAGGDGESDSDGDMSFSLFADENLLVGESVQSFSPEYSPTSPTPMLYKGSGRVKTLSLSAEKEKQLPASEGISWFSMSVLRPFQ